MNDVDLSFVVGTSEQHRVDFHWRQATGEAWIEVDGVQVLYQKNPFGALGTERRRSYEVTVGQAESHSVVVEHRAPLWAPLFRQHSFWVLVDGSPVETQ